MKGQSQEIVVMVRSDKGMSRITLESTQTVNELWALLVKLIGVPQEGMSVNIENASLNKVPGMSQLKTIPTLKNGATVDVQVSSKFKNAPPKQVEVSKPVLYTASGKAATQQQLAQVEHHTRENKEHTLTQFCQHGPQAKCVSCLSQQSDKKKEDEKPVNKCVHGPGGKCLNCTPYQEQKGTRKQADKILCQHGPNGKCTNCLDDNEINVKHLSFDQYLLDQKFKCRGQHPEEGKCNNCLPPTAISYKLKRDCKNHAPYPQAMCNACMPPSILLKTQIYRHVDYVEFLNVQEMSNLVQYWTSKNKSEQRAGLLFGYYSEDPNYKNGVRAIVEAIYEPPQRGSVGGVELLVDPFEPQVVQLAHSLGLEIIGWIFTTINHDCFLSSEEMRQAAKYQQMYAIRHPSGCTVSKFLTVVLRTKKDNPDEVMPEVYMVSDQGQQLELDGIFTNSGRRKVLQVRKPVNDEDVVPNFIYNGKSVTEFEPDFFIVNVAHGYNPSSNYNILKLYDFPVENRSTLANQNDVKQFLHRNQKKPSHVRFANFHLLVFLCKLVDFDTIARIADFVGQECEIQKDLLDIIQLYAGP